MKNNNGHEIKQARASRLHKAVTTDILVMPAVVQSNQRRLSSQPKRKRRRDYAKKIMNDPFVFNV
ncbi:MAG: hypothetical protein V4702_01190 [Patescibacteria group bacterium]